MRMNRQSGFTLIELVVVIVLLGILAVTAMSRFQDLSREATIAKLQGMQGALSSGARAIFFRAHLDGLDQGAQQIVLDGNTIRLHSGYPIGNWFYGFRYAVINTSNVTYTSSASSICNKEWCGRGNQTQIPSGAVSTTYPGLVGKVYPRGYSWNDQCGVYYVNYADGREAVTGLETADC